MNKTKNVYYSFNFVAHLPVDLSDEEMYLEAAKILRDKINSLDDGISQYLEEYDRDE